MIVFHAIFFCLLLLLANSSRAADIPPKLTLTYSVEKSGLGRGQYEINFEKQNGQLVTSSKAVPIGVAAAFSNDESMEKVVYNISNRDLLPIRYVQSRTGSKKYVRSANLNWDKQKVSFSEAEDKSLPNGITVDAGSFPVSLMWRPLPKLANATGYIVGSKKIRAYRYAEPVGESLETPVGTFDTLRIEKNRVDKENRQFVVWVVPELDNLPIKIEDRKGNNVTRFLLENAEGIDLK